MNRVSLVRSAIFLMFGIVSYELIMGLLANDSIPSAPTESPHSATTTELFFRIDNSIVFLENLIANRRNNEDGEELQRQWQSTLELLRKFTNSIEDEDLDEYKSLVSLEEQQLYNLSLSEKKESAHYHVMNMVLQWKVDALQSNEKHWRRHLQHRIETAPRDPEATRDVTVIQYQQIRNPATGEQRTTNESTTTFKWPIPCLPFHYVDDELLTKSQRTDSKNGGEENGQAAEKFQKQHLRFAVVVATYRRSKNGRAFSDYINNVILNLKRQTYPHWKLFLIGDHYDVDEEFHQLASLSPNNAENDQEEDEEAKRKIRAVNLPWAAEREGTLVGAELWNSGGVHAVNIGLNLAQEEGFTHVAHLDDDDSWHPEHLEELARAYMDFPDATMAYSKAFYSGIGGAPFPPDVVKRSYNNLYITPAYAIHSSASWRSELLPLRYQTTHEIGGIVAADANLWYRMTTDIVKNNASMVHSPRCTVAHLSEGGVGALIDPFV
eukprot:TRINITY_DN4893_c0_g1_i2.p1 TRINITY_DN4893_c0_g1~~TRINITY_DN4893_c0_g1_i2.p1  ORF type:complete len:494 (+),score=72.31 TRINITY_DN4893_c0_g1_i2:60-1541(+)